MYIYKKIIYKINASLGVMELKVWLALCLLKLILLFYTFYDHKKKSKKK